jgi:hypothetical protein
MNGSTQVPPTKQETCIGTETCTQGQGCISQSSCHVCNNGGARIGFRWDEDSQKCINVGTGQSLDPLSSAPCADGKACFQGYGCCNSMAECNDKVTTDTYPIACDSGGCHPKLCDSSGCYTAIGFIPTDPTKFVSYLFALLLAISSAIAVFLIIVAGFKFLTSQGNPEALQGAREQLIAAVVGLLFVIFSFAILQIIGVNILKIFS